MKRKYTPVTKILVVFSAALVGYAIAMLIHGNIVSFILWLCAALISFGIGVVVANGHLKKNQESEVKEKEQETANKMEQTEVDETEFEDVDIVTEPAYNEIKPPKEDTTKDVVEELQD